MGPAADGRTARASADWPGWGPSPQDPLLETRCCIQSMYVLLISCFAFLLSFLSFLFPFLFLPTQYFVFCYFISFLYYFTFNSIPECAADKIPARCLHQECQLAIPCRRTWDPLAFICLEFSPSLFNEYLYSEKKNYDCTTGQLVRGYQILPTY